jgi:hypothetical protein
MGCTSSTSKDSSISSSASSPTNIKDTGRTDSTTNTNSNNKDAPPLIDVGPAASTDKGDETRPTSPADVDVAFAPPPQQPQIAPATSSADPPHDSDVIAALLNDQTPKDSDDQDEDEDEAKDEDEDDDDDDDTSVDTEVPPEQPAEPTHSITPKVGFVLKTKRDRDQSKVFVNVYYHDEKDLAKAVLSAPAKRSIDKKGVECEAYDVSIPMNYFMKCSTSEDARKEVGYPRAVVLCAFF